MISDDQCWRNYRVVPILPRHVFCDDIPPTCRQYYQLNPSGGIFLLRYGSPLSKNSCSLDSEHTSYLIFSSSSVSSPSYSIIYISESFLLFSDYIHPEIFSWSGRISSSSPEMISFDGLVKTKSMSLSSSACFGSSLMYSFYVPMCLFLFRMTYLVS